MKKLPYITLIALLGYIILADSLLYDEISKKADKTHLKHTTECTLDTILKNYNIHDTSKSFKIDISRYKIVQKLDTVYYLQLKGKSLK